ncbi:hypothetical protein PENSUB_5648 [Penicillium subrubescens]|uniref:Transcription factor domain-containing protein n=1 Tax=Penicillium subrubescens TaxID=1316194 RepID=A0A1Q5U728_9EURO|nr:hypothetical protein PENSUB_5648 [Penicillium subrubescens]
MESLLSAIQSFIGARGETGPAVNVIQPTNGYGSASSTTSHSNSTLVNPTDTNLAFSDGSTFAAGSIATVSPHQNAILLPNQYPLSPNYGLSIQADERLNFFRSRMLPFFPFIDLTPNMTTWYLRQNRPFLFQAIHTVTTFSTQERLPKIEELKHVLFTSALLEVQSNIDLLQGLLTYLTWSTDAFLGRADLLSRLMMLAISLVYDLRLFKPSSKDVEVMMTITQGRADDNSQSPADKTPHELLERQRAVLACFILSSNISSHLGRQDALRWTPQTEDALRLIAMSKPCHSDELFVSQVRLQLLKQRAEDIRRQDEADYLSTGSTPLASAPRLFYIKALRRQLQELRASFRPDHPHIDPEWDCQVVRSTVDLIPTIDAMLQRIEMSSKEPELQCNDHLLKYLSKLLNRCRMWAEPRWHLTSQVQDVETRMSRNVNPDTISHNYHVPDLDQMTWMQSMDLGNEQWFEDVLGMPATTY